MKRVKEEKDPNIIDQEIRVNKLETDLLYAERDEKDKETIDQLKDDLKYEKEKLTKMKDQAKDMKERVIKLTKNHFIEGKLFTKGTTLKLGGKITEAFKAGSSFTVVEKLIPVLEKRIGAKMEVSDYPLSYSNNYGNFAGYFVLFGNEALRINFSLGSSDRIVSCDYYSGPSEEPDVTIEFDYNDNIIQIVAAIEDVVVSGVTSNPYALAERLVHVKGKELKERKAMGDESLESWILSNERVNLDILQNTRLSNVWKHDFSPWAKDKDVAGMSLPTFLKVVKNWLEENRLQNKYFYNAEIKKGGKNEVVIVDSGDEGEWLDTFEQTVSEKFEQLKAFIDLVIAGHSNGLLLTGKPGQGKTYTTLETIKAAGIKPVYSSGGIKTAKDLYMGLWRNKEAVIVIDDCDDIFKAGAALNILKAALDTNTQKPRQITYLDKDFVTAAEWNEMTSNQQDKNIPSTFLFDGQLIMITNLPPKKLNSAVSDRVFTLDLSLSNEEALARIKQKIADFPPDVGADIKIQAFTFLLNNIENIETINFRQFEKVTALAATRNPNWQKWAYTMGVLKYKG
jgi:hypothetical protein